MPPLRSLKLGLLRSLPNHWISRITFWLTRLRSPLARHAIRLFIRLYKVDMDEAQQTDPQAYSHFNAFFTRALKADARPIIGDSQAIACPADGTISQLGTIKDGRIIQAKNHDYSVLELFAGSNQRAAPFHQGKFCTIYLSPRDYHRVHMPVAGQLREMIYVPGRLLTVSTLATQTIPRLFARNERVVSVFETERGPMAVVLVGALNVGAIETAWAGPITPPRGNRVYSIDYANTDHPVRLDRGQELGRFNMGSTVIVLFPRDVVSWATHLGAESPVKMGQSLGQLL